MKENATAYDYFHLSTMLYQSCWNPGDRHLTDIQAELDSVLSLLAGDGLDFKQARTHEQGLREVRNWIEHKLKELEVCTELPAEIKELLAKTAPTLFRSLYAEAAERFLLTLDRSTVSDQLRAVLPRLVDIESRATTTEHKELVATQRVLLAETIRCLETGAYRAAMVMGWNLTFEYIRQWIFLDPVRLKQFNDTLTQKYRNKTDTNEAIDDYAGYFVFGEAYVIDTANEAKLLSKNAYRTLKEALHNRNQFAHPTFMRTDRDIATGYIATLVINIITQPEFRYFP